jgi:hypothetical protein
MSDIEKIKALALSADPANKNLALQLSKAAELNNEQLQYACGNILDKVASLGSPKEVRDELDRMNERSSYLYNRMLAKM